MVDFDLPVESETSSALFSDATAALLRVTRRPGVSTNSGRLVFLAIVKIYVSFTTVNGKNCAEPEGLKKGGEVNVNKSSQNKTGFRYETYLGVFPAWERVTVMIFSQCIEEVRGKKGFCFGVK